MPWALYDALIQGIPEEVLVKDYCLGLYWAYVEAECGMGVSHTVRGGTLHASNRGNFIGQPLRAMASLSKSWHYEEATLGVAALNAWYCQPHLLDALGARYDTPRNSESKRETPKSTYGAWANNGHKQAAEHLHGDEADNVLKRGRRDAFEVMRPRIEATPHARVVVVGHFPHMERLKRSCDLTVLERVCADALDVPDPACEFVLPQADFVFMTGITLTNKTAVRLLQLAQHAVVSMVGPSVVMCQTLLDAGVDMAAGRVVIDPERAKLCVKSGGIRSFEGSLRMVTIER